jgi:RNA recognition motif-containing protein
MTKLFVVGFPREMAEIELDQLFTSHALVRTITIIRDMQTGESKGYAFVDMMDEPGTARVIDALDGMTFGNRVMSVRVADQKPQAQQPRPNSFSSPGRAGQFSNRTRNEGRAGNQNRPKRPKTD